MSIPEACIEASLDDGPYITCFYSAPLLEVWGPVGDNIELLETLPKAKAQSMCERLNAEDRARRVIRALAKDMPEDAIAEAVRVYWDVGPNQGEHAYMQNAIAAFLNHVAGDQP